MSPAVDPAPPRSAATATSRDRRLALALVALAFVVYNANLRSVATGDSVPARLQPLTLLRWGTLSLDRVEAPARQGFPDPYWLPRDTAGRRTSSYPVVTPLLVTPLFVPAVLYLEARGWEPGRVDRVSDLFQKLAASLVTAAGVGLLFLVLRRRAERRDAFLLAVAYAFGTNTWVTSSQALWQHAPAQLFVIVALALFTGPATAGRVLLAGLVVGLLPANRPPDVFLALGFVLAAFAWAGRRTPLFLAAAALPPLLALGYNVATFGDLRGGYGVIGAGRLAFFEGPLLEGVAGLLASPAAGLFVFSPFLLALPLGARAIWADRERRGLVAALLCGVVLQLFLYAKTDDWRGGWCYGPRFLADALPILVFLLPPVLARLRRPGRAAFVAAVVFAVAVQAIGAFCFPEGRSYRADDPWQPASAAFVLEARAGLAEPTFVGYLRGAVGAIRTGSPRS